jgi:hypothetical protein
MSPDNGDRTVLVLTVLVVLWIAYLWANLAL